MSTLTTNLTGRQEQQVLEAWDEFVNGVAEDIGLTAAQAAVVIRYLAIRIERLTPSDLVLENEE